MPDLRRAYPRQGISRRSCMLMRRILLKVGRGVRRRISQLGSCLHPPGADQSSVKHSVSNAFLLSHDSSNQLHHSMFCDRGFLTWSRSSSVKHSVFQCVSTFGTVLTNLIRISVVANVHLRTYASSGFCSRQPLVALFSPHKPAQKSWPGHRQPLRSVHVCTSR